MLIHFSDALKSFVPKQAIREIVDSMYMSRLNVYAGIRAGVLITSLLVIGLLSNHIREATLVVLKTIFLLRWIETQMMRKEVYHGVDVNPETYQ